MTFEKKILITMAIAFVVFVGSLTFVVATLASHSHEIASGAGSLAHDFMKSAKNKE